MTFGYNTNTNTTHINKLEDWDFLSLLNPSASIVTTNIFFIISTSLELSFNFILFYSRK